MVSPGQTPGPSTPEPIRRNARGFTLFELGLALLAVALAGYIATTEARKFQHRTEREQFISEMRRLATVFETYRAEKGEWPAATNAEVKMPRGMETTLANTPWLTGPPVGGSYEWVPPAPVIADDKEGEKKPAAGGTIAVTAFFPSPPLTLTTDDLRVIDGALDDGNLATGRFRTGFNGWPVYRVNPPR